MSRCYPFCTCLNCPPGKHADVGVEMLDKEPVLGKRAIEQDKTTTSSQLPVKKRSREEVFQDSIKAVISVGGPSELTNYVIYCTDGEFFYVCFEFLQTYTKYFNPTLRKMNPDGTRLDYRLTVVADVLCVAVFGCTYPWPKKEVLILDHHHQRFQCMDYIGCDYGEKILMEFVSLIGNSNKAKAYVLVPEYREVLRGYLRDNIVSLRNKSEYWPQLKEHIDDILVD
jgi:hypothetical protein